jgi:fucose permease
MLYAMNGAMLTSFIDYYNLQASSQGAMGSIQSAGQVIALCILIWQAGKFAKSTMMTVSFIGVAVILCAVSFTPPWLLFLTYYLLLGLVFGAISSMTNSIIADLYDGADAPKYMSRLHGVFGLGGLTAPLFYRALFALGFSWDVSIRITVLVIVAILISYLILSRRALKTLELPKGSNRYITRGEFFGFMKRGSNILLVLGALFYMGHQSVIVVWVIRYVEVFLSTPSLAALSLSLFWGGIVVSRLSMHRLLHVSPIKIVIVGNFISTALIFAGIMSGSAIVITCLTFLIGFANGITIPILISVCCSENDCNTMLPTNFLNFAMYVALIVCPLAVGAIEAASSLSTGMYLSALCTLMCGVSTFLYYRIKQRGQKAMA